MDDPFHIFCHRICQRSNAALLLFAIALFLTTGCKEMLSSDDMVKTTNDQPVLPVLRTESLSLSSEARVKMFHGKATRLKKSDQKAGYRELAMEDVLSDGDIVVLQKNTVLILDVPQMGEHRLEANDQPRWYTITVKLQ
jgi:hypothetical protein